MALRVRVTVIATVAVAAAIAVFSVGLILALEAGLEREVREEIIADVEAGRAGTDDVDEDRAGAAGPDRPPPVAGAPLLDAARDALGAADADRVEFLLDGDLVVAERVVGPDGTSRIVVASGPTTEVDRATRRLAGLLAVGGPLLLLAVGAVAWMATGRALAPITRLRQQAETISHSTLARRLPTGRTDDEVSALAETLNRMLERIDASACRQREFVSDAAHELRSPIATIRTELEVALAHPAGVELADLATSVLDENARLDALVDDLLLLARLDESPAALGAPRPLDLRRLAQDEADRAWPLPVSVGGEHVIVPGDQVLLSRAVSNLLDNATRHARTGVWVAVRAAGSTALLAVADDGPGIAPEERQRIFERFARTDHGRVRSEGGAGLGLAVVRRVAEVHGGTVTVDRARQGGALLVLALPT